MVLLSVVAKFNETNGNVCKVKIDGGINIQKLRWVGYAVSLDGVSIDTQNSVRETIATGGQNNTQGFQGHLIPNELVVNLDVIGTNQIHIANSPQIDANGLYIDNSNPYSNGLPLPLSDELRTIKMGMGDIQFDIGRNVRNEVVVEVLKYDDTFKLVPMTTATPALVQADGVVDTNADGVGVDNGVKLDNVFGSVALQSIILYFHYDFSAYF